MFDLFSRLNTKYKFTMKGVFRIILLFLIGVIMTYVTHFLKNKSGGLFDYGLTIFGCFGPSIWLPLSCGFAAAIIGWLYPCIDMRLGQISFYKQEWASVLRCLALFFGINHAPDKLDFTSDGQLRLCLLGMCLGLWWFFDQSVSGLGLTAVSSCGATAVYRLLDYADLYRFRQPAMADCWLPCVFFSGALTVGIVGRQLAKSDVLEKVRHNHEHAS